MTLRLRSAAAGFALLLVAAVMPAWAAHARAHEGREGHEQRERDRGHAEGDEESLELQDGLWAETEHGDETLAVDSSLPVPRMGPSAVRAGDVVRIEWPVTSIALEEFELMLSVDGGRHFVLRISPELAGGECAYAWRVPNLAAPDARIRLRARIGGREVDGPVGAAFAIVADSERPAERWLFREGGYEPPVEGALPAERAFDSGAAPAELHAGAAAGAAEAPPRITWIGEASTVAAPQRGRASSSARSAAAQAVTPARRHPMRN